MTDDPRPGFNAGTAVAGKTLGQIAHEAGERAGRWARTWSDMGESQRAEWEEIGAAVARAAKSSAGTAVADAVNAIVRDCCESDRPEKWDADTIEMRVSDLRLIVERHVAALAAPKAEAWQPIATAPKDGREFIAVWQRQGDVMHVVKWNVLHKFWQGKGTALLGFERNATAWMPLPAPPTSPAPQEES